MIFLGLNTPSDYGKKTSSIEDILKNAPKDLDSFVEIKEALDKLDKKIAQVSSVEIPSIEGLLSASDADATYQKKGDYVNSTTLASELQKAISSQDFSEFALKSELPLEYNDSELRDLISEKQPAGNYLTEHQSLEDYALKSDIPNTADFISVTDADVKYQIKGDYLTEQSLEDYIKASDVEEQINSAVVNLINGAPETRDTLKEISDLLDQHGSEVTSIASVINDHASNIDNIIEKELADINVLRKTIAELAGRLSLVENTQKASSDSSLVIASSVEDVTNIISKADTNLVLSTKSVVEDPSVKSTLQSSVYKSIALVNSENNGEISVKASDAVTLDGVTINGGETAGHGKINYSTPELIVKNTIIGPCDKSYNVFEGEQSVAEGGRQTEKVLIENLSVEEPTITHNVINVYTPVEGAEITIRNSYFNLDMAKSNVLRISNYLDSENVTITFENVDWTYEPKGYTEGDIPWAGLVLIQAVKDTRDSAWQSGDASKYGTWNIIIKNCRYNGVKVSEENWGSANQIGYFYNDKVKQSERLGEIVNISFE